MMNTMTHDWEDQEEVWAVAASLFLQDDPCDQKEFPNNDTPTPILTDTDHLIDLPMGEHHLDMDLDISTPPTKVRRVNRRREEILFLREQAAQLEKQLLATRRRMEKDEQLDRDLQPFERELLAAAWSTIATRQRNQREKSEAEHARLLQLIEEQRQLARTLQRFARRHAVHEIPAPLAVYAQLQPHNQDTHMITQPASFEELERALQSMYEQRDAVFRDPRFDAVLSTLRVGRIVNENTPHACVEMLDARILPFDIETVANALWHSMVHRVNISVTYKDEKVDPHRDIIQKGFVAAIDLPLYQASVQARVVVQRIVEDNRIFILRATHFEPTSLLNADIEPFSVRHYQWNVIEAPHHQRLRTNRFATAQIQSFDLSFPSLPTTTPHGPNEQKILQFCESAVAYHLDLSRQALENILVTNTNDTSSQSVHQTQSTTTIKLEAC